MPLITGQVQNLRGINATNYNTYGSGGYINTGTYSNPQYERITQANLNPITTNTVYYNAAEINNHL
jgi:hypothetical protein